MIKKDFDKVLTPAQVDAAAVIINEAQLEGITQIINVGTSLVESLNCLALAENYPSTFAAIGIHPNDLTDSWKDDIAHLKKILMEKDPRYIVAIGECGMDFHYPGYNQSRQADAFKTQIELALEYNLPLVIHTRDAGEATIRILEQFKDPALRGVIHCFSEDYSFAQAALALQFVLGIGGTVTYPKNNELRDVVRHVGIEHIILETDAPYLTPQLLRGKQNHPKNIRIIAEYLAQLLDISLEEVTLTTTKTSMRLFNLSEICTH